RLVDGDDALALLAAGEIERVARDPLRRARRDHLDALDDARRDLVLDAGVEVLRVLADDDEIDACERRAHAGERADRAHVRVEVERLPERDVDAPVPDASDLGLERPLEPQARAADRGDERVRDRAPAFVEGDLARVLDVPGDPRAGRFHHVHGGLDHLGADPVARDERRRPRRGTGPRPPLARGHRMPSTLWSCGSTRTSGCTPLASAWKRSSAAGPIVVRGVSGSVSGVRKSGAPGAVVATRRAPRSTSSGAVASSTGIFT